MPIFEDPLVVKQSYIELSGSNTPDAAPAGKARIWYDQANTVLKFSVNGSSFGENPGALSLQDLSAHVLTTAPTAAAAAAVLRLDSGTFAGSAAGTVLGINLGSGTADLINAQKAGADRFKVSETGIATMVRAVVGAATTVLGTLSVHCTDLNTKGVVVKMAASQGQNPIHVQTSADAAIFQVDPNGAVTGGDAVFSTGRFSVPSNGIIFATTAGTAQAANQLEIRNNAGSPLVAFAAGGHLTFADAVNIIAGTTTGTRIGTVGGAAGQKLAFWNSTPIVQPLLATGAGATVDNVITTLQNLGLCRQT